MYDKNELCKKITALYPDIGECGIDVSVEYDEEQKAWVVDLKKDHHELRTFLEERNIGYKFIAKRMRKEAVWSVLNMRLPGIQRIPLIRSSIFVLSLANAVLMKSRKIRQES